MAEKLTGYFIILSAALFLCGRCVEPSQDGTVRMELPRIQAGDAVIDYTGFTDIAYGDSCEFICDSHKTAFTVKYDSGNLIPVWVAYSLSSRELSGYADRKGKQFHQDPGLPLPQAERSDYKGSGWTNGHMAPAADFTWSDSALEDTFLYTNICPQDRTMNSGSWQRLENRVREWAGMFGEIYVVTGPIIGDALNGAIGLNRVTVPDAIFKAVLARDGEGWQSVAFIMENSPLKQPYPDCCVTVNTLESITGIDLFCALDDTMEETVEDGYDRSFWGF